MKAKRLTDEADTGVRPALSPEARENQMIALAVDLREKTAGRNGILC